MLSLPHLIVIFIVALVVFGPEKLPELARQLGKWTAEFRRLTGDLRSSFEDQMRQLEREAAEIERKKRELSAQQATVAATAASATLALESRQQEEPPENASAVAVTVRLPSEEGDPPDTRATENDVPPPVNSDPPGGVLGESSISDSANVSAPSAMRRGSTFEEQTIAVRLPEGEIIPHGDA